jgi:hypothetical protein
MKIRVEYSKSEKEEKKEKKKAKRDTGREIRTGRDSRGTVVVADADGADIAAFQAINALRRKGDLKD